MLIKEIILNLKKEINEQFRYMGKRNIILIPAPLFIESPKRSFMKQDQNLTDAVCADLQKHAFSVNDHIADGTIRNMDIFAAL